jgi:hypothetical protein
MNDKKSYYAVIPADVRYSSITANAKLLYGEITALCNEKGFCWANNQYFADLYNVSKISVSKWISSLVEYGFIKIEIDSSDGNKRKIYIIPIKEKFNRVLKKSLRPIKEKFNHNNTYNNKKKTNIYIYQKFLDEYNTTLHRKTKSMEGWKKNAEFWLTVYSEEDILAAIREIPRDPFWKDKMDLTILFRRKNPQGESVDYIQKLLDKAESKKPKNFMIGGMSEV